MKLFVYEHCPFCVRPRILIGIKSLNLPLCYLANDDEKAHIDRIGVKQVPFLEKADGSYLVESLDICRYLDTVNGNAVLKPASADTRLVDLTQKLAGITRVLTYPRSLQHPLNAKDFPTPSAKAYLRRKKEARVGDFKANFIFPEAAIDAALALLRALNSLLVYPYATSDQLSWDDIFVFPILRNLTQAQDILSLPQNVSRYLDRLAEETGVLLYKPHRYEIPDVA